MPTRRIPGENSPHPLCGPGCGPEEEVAAVIGVRVGERPAAGAADRLGRVPVLLASLAAVRGSGQQGRPGLRPPRPAAGPGTRPGGGPPSRRIPARAQRRFGGTSNSLQTARHTVLASTPSARAWSTVRSPSSDRTWSLATLLAYASPNCARIRVQNSLSRTALPDGLPQDPRPRASCG